MNKIKILSTAYNNEQWVSNYANSIKKQTYENYEVYFYDDCSTDKTYETILTHVKEDSRWTVIKMHENKKRLWIFKNMLDDAIEDNDIVAIIDGDDWLANTRVLENVDAYYSQHNPWVSYGGMLVWDGGNTVVLAQQQNSLHPDNVLKERAFRQDLWRASHLKTMRGFIWNRISKDDFISEFGNDYFPCSDDMVYMLPALEMCQPGKISSFTFPTYIYNAPRTARTYGHNHSKGIHCVAELRTRPKYDILPIISTKLAGGLGNQMFQISAALSAGQKFGYVAMFNPNIYNTHELPSNGNYACTIFKQITFDNTFTFEHKYNESGYQYQEIVVPPNTQLNGYFQSEKYFDKKLIRKTFTCPEHITTYLTKKYKEQLNKKSVSIHVRRGDYLKFQQHHPICTMDYYTKAMDRIKGEHYLIFSDDKEWCKENFIGEKYTIVEEKDYIELFLMTKCFGNIISNSTFSWWGAWLNTCPDRQVIAPSKWFGENFKDLNTEDLIPEEWIKI